MEEDGNKKSSYDARVGKQQQEMQMSQADMIEQLQAQVAQLASPQKGAPSDGGEAAKKKTSLQLHDEIFPTMWKGHARTYPIK